MRGPKPPLVTLTAAERHALETLTRRHTTAQQRAIRARIILAAAEGHNNAQIARHVGVDVDPSVSGVRLGSASRAPGWRT